MKTVFRKSGRYDWQSACQLCVSHPLHASFFVRKLWSYFVPVAPDRATQAALEALYRDGYQVQPGRSRRSCSTRRSTTGPRMVKPPVVHVAGLLRRIGAGITTTDWAWIGALSGQQLFYPPNVAGWDDTRWLDTATFRGRWIAVQRILQDRKLDPAEGARSRPTRRRARRRRSPSGTTRRSRDATHAALLHFARAALADAGKAALEAGSSTRCCSRTRCAS